MIKARNKTVEVLYKNIMKPIFFKQDPEKVHDRMIKVGKMLGSNPITRAITTFNFGYSNDMLKQEVRGITFKNPVGLAAGFDKNAEIIKVIGATGFGYEEAGSITALQCDGNAKPRLWRLKESKGLVVNYGLKSDGAKEVQKRLENKKFKIPVGISIAKTNCRLTAKQEDGISDYIESYRTLQNIGDYVTINISCPNAYGGLPFTKPEDLDKLLGVINKEEKTKPIFIKFPPDVDEKQLDGMLETIGKYKIDGLIVSNLTKNRNNKFIKEKDLPEKGGVSGKPLTKMSTELLRKIYKKTGDKYVLVGCGGIFTADDAYEKIKAGATLLQLITGMIFEGPQMVGEINRGLVEKLKADGYKNISEAVGVDVKNHE